MAEVDTSSYRLPTQPSALDTVGKLQGLQQGAQAIEQGRINIDKSKLELVNQGLDYMTREINSLPPDATPQNVFKVLQGAVNQKYLTPEMYSQAVKEIPTDQKDMPAFKDRFIARALHAKEALEYYAGTPGVMNTGQTIAPTRVSPRPGFGIRQGEGAPIQLQAPPTTGVVNPNTGQPALLGPQNPQLAPGTTSRPGAPPMALPVGPVASPAIKGQSSNFGGNVLGATVEAPTPAQSVADRFPNIPRGPATGMPPMFEEGRKQLAADQELATQKLTAVKPALAALDLMKDLRSGPGTETWNKAVAFAKANGIIPITANDPTAVYQEVNKYLNQYVQGGGTRSDADLAQRELSNPNVTQQISPALEKLTRNTIALDRIQAARGNSFTDANSNPRSDLDKYPQHRSNFPAKMDEQAFIVDKLDPEERQKLFKDMLARKENDPKRKRFFESLAIAKRTGVFQ